MSNNSIIKPKLIEEKYISTDALKTVRKDLKLFSLLRWKIKLIYYQILCSLIKDQDTKVGEAINAIESYFDFNQLHNYKIKQEIQSLNDYIYKENNGDNIDESALHNGKRTENSTISPE